MQANRPACRLLARRGSIMLLRLWGRLRIEVENIGPIVVTPKRERIHRRTMFDLPILSLQGLQLAYVDVVVQPVGDDHYRKYHSRLRGSKSYREENEGLTQGVRGRGLCTSFEGKVLAKGDEIQVGGVDHYLDREEKTEGVPLRHQAIDSNPEEHRGNDDEVCEGVHCVLSSLSTLESVRAPTTAEARTSAKTSRTGESPVEISWPMSTKVALFVRLVNWERLVARTARLRARTTARPVTAPASLVNEVERTSLAHFSCLTSITVNSIKTATAP